MRTPLMGILSLFAAPVAFHIACTLHQGTKEALEITGGIASVGESIFLLTLIKGVEYACLGAAIGSTDAAPGEGCCSTPLWGSP